MAESEAPTLQSPTAATRKESAELLWQFSNLFLLSRPFERCQITAAHYGRIPEHLPEINCRMPAGFEDPMARMDTRPDAAGGCMQTDDGIPGEQDPQ